MIRIGVARGGTSDEFEVSIKTGASVLKNLPEGTQGVDILVTRDGTWHIGGVPKGPEELQVSVDLVWNALHGGYGEDGRIARALEELKIPYTGSSALPSSVALNKLLAKELFKRAGLKIPSHMVIEDYRTGVTKGREAEKIEELAHKIFRSIPPPWILKPVRGGSSINTFAANTFSELVQALVNLFDYGGDIIVEQFVRGKEVSVGVADGFRGQRRYATMPVQIIKKSHVFDYSEKLNRASYLSPSTLTQKEKMELEEMAILAHDFLGLRDLSVVDFVVTPRTIYIIEVNNNPKLHEASVFSNALASAGSSLKELVGHVSKLALGRK